MSIENHLSLLAEQMPGWLQTHSPGDLVNLEDFFATRTVFYPGAGFDGQPVELFGSTSFAHGFVYVDYGVEHNEILGELCHPKYGFKGYRLLDRIPLTQDQLSPGGWVPHLTRGEIGSDPYWFSKIKPYAFLQILEREKHFKDSHGPERIAIIFVGGDGIASYDAIYGQGGRKPPSALIIQDHGYGGNYARFDDESLLHTLALRTHQLPEYLLVAESSKAWAGYSCAIDDDAVYGGCHGTVRRLFKKQV